RVDTWQKTDTGYERVTTTTGPKGGETTRTRDVSHEGNNVTINQDRTLKRANGESVTPEQVRKARESNPALDAKIGRTERLARTGRALNAPSTGVGQNRLARRAAAAESNAAPAPANAPETIEGKPALERSGEAPSAAGAKRHRRAGGAGRR
ncbi:hypothetical protein HYR69_09480, partial [Candidatus Sumerlaeota bacterium]|nr:hypothetical protein [Candidatus Sumerlaeota bacterium]